MPCCIIWHDWGREGRRGRGGEQERGGTSAVLPRQKREQLAEDVWRVSLEPIESRTGVPQDTALRGR